MLRLLLLNLSELYASARGLSISRVSTLVFADGKVLTRIAGGGDITTGRFESAICWFSNNWPDGEPWPENGNGILSHFSSPASSSAGDDVGASVTPPAQKGAPTVCQGRAEVARLAHNQEVAGSNPVPATDSNSPDYLPSGEAGAQRSPAVCAPASISGDM